MSATMTSPMTWALTMIVPSAENLTPSATSTLVVADAERVVQAVADRPSGMPILSVRHLSSLSA